MVQLSSSAEDDERLRPMSKKWDELRKREKEAEHLHDEVSNCLPFSS